MEIDPQQAETNPTYLWAITRPTDEGAIVVALLDDDERILTPGEAREWGFAIIETAIAAETEMRVALSLVGNPGFGKSSVAWRKKFVAALGKVQSLRPPTMHRWISPKIGFKPQFKQATMTLMAWEKEIELHLDEARSFATSLIGAAEATETDNFIVDFFEKIGVESESAHQTLNDFRTYRDGSRLRQRLYG